MSESRILIGQILACASAASHLLFFAYLNGKPANGPGHHIPQTYSTTASILLAGMFGLMLRISISVAFTQHLWRLLRATPIRVATIERLFTLRSSPTSLFHVDVLAKA